MLNDLSSTPPVSVTIAALVFISDEDEAALREERGYHMQQVQLLLLQPDQGLAIVSCSLLNLLIRCATMLQSMDYLVTQTTATSRVAQTNLSL